MKFVGASIFTGTVERCFKFRRRVFVFEGGGRRERERTFSAIVNSGRNALQLCWTSLVIQDELFQDPGEEIINDYSFFEIDFLFVRVIPRDSYFLDLFRETCRNCLVRKFEPCRSERINPLPLSLKDIKWHVRSKRYILSLKQTRKRDRPPPPCKPM